MISLLVRDEEGEVIDRFDWPDDRDELIIGRDEQADLTLNHTKISGLHCRIRREDDHQYLLVDLDSTNGTTFNGREIEREYLVPGNRFVLPHRIIQLGTEEQAKAIQEDPSETDVAESGPEETQTGNLKTLIISGIVLLGVLLIGLLVYFLMLS